MAACVAGQTILGASVPLMRGIVDYPLMTGQAARYSVAALILGESISIAAIGAAIGIALTFPVGDWFAAQVGTLFPVFEVSGQTVALQIACALGVGVLAAIVPGRRAATVKIVDQFGGVSPMRSLISKMPATPRPSTWITL